MSLKNINSKLQSERGFTIVELLIVIVVIAILAAITIVAYNGVTTRANATKAQTNASAIQKVAEAYNADNTANPSGGYPSLANLNAYSGIATKPAGVTVVAAAANAVTSTNGTTTVSYMTTTDSKGGCIGWWDYNKTSSQFTLVFVGNATGGSATTCTNS